MSPSRRPNVLWIQTDEQRPDSLGCYGSDWARTPNVDALAARGTTFHECHVQSPMCVPSRTSMLLGRYPQELGVYSNSVQGQEGVVDPAMPAFPNLFADAGYRTASLGKWHTPAHPTWQERVAFYAFLDVADAVQLYEPYTDEDHRVIKNPGSFMDTVDIPVILGGVYPHHDWGNDPGSALTEMGIEWIRAHAAKAGDDEPFLLRVSYAWPHTPVLPPSPWDRLYEPDEVTCNAHAAGGRAHDERAEYDRWLAGVEGGMRMSLETWRRAAADYYGLCAFVDHEVGRLVRALRDAGVLDDTIVAFNTDHGRAMGEYGHLQKGTYDREVWRVPFVISAPALGVPSGEHRHELCELLDFGTTLCRLAGLDPADGMRGRDLFDDTQPAPDAVFGALDMFRRRRCAVRTERFRFDCTYAQGPTGERPGDRHGRDEIDANLFDLVDDPFETRNLAGDPAHRSTVDELYGRLDEWMRMAPAGPVSGRTAPATSPGR